MPKTYSVFGDSISTFKGIIPCENRWYYDEGDTNATGVASPGGTWWMRAIAAEDGSFLANASFSGALVQGAGFPAGRVAERARQLLGPGGGLSGGGSNEGLPDGGMSDRGSDADPPDAVLVFIGINDYGWGSPEAQVVGGSEAAPKCVSAADFSSVDPAGPAPEGAAARFEAAYGEMLANIHEAAPGAEIWCVTLLPGRVAGSPRSTFCYRLRGVDIDDYNEAIRAAAARAGARVADVRALGYDYDSTDGTHPNSEGMAQFAKLVEAAICKARGDEESALAALAGYPERLRSKRTCEEPTCIGCPFSSVTPSRWTCVCGKQA